MSATQSQLQNNINHCRNRISETGSYISKLEKKLIDYYEGLKNYRSAKDSFNEFIHVQQTSANKISGAASTFKFSQGYSSTTTEMLNGIKRQRTEDRFSSMETKINRAIADTEEEIEREKRNLYNLNNQLDSLQRQLRQLMAETN